MISVDSPNATLLSDQLYEYDSFLFQLVKDPTRNGNILDLVFVTSLDLVYDLKVSLPFSDHNLISMLLSRKSFPGRKSQKLNSSFKKADWDHLRNLLHYTPWHCAFMDTDIDRLWIHGLICFYLLSTSVSQGGQRREIQTHHG